ncbi:MAG TPA: M48 family metalloprotease [Rhodocyclaceae bacterium]|jgi:predicted Zn-dependent protease|nr:M48 family metalloprotease [Rhodocyclaceae bacterium]
MPLSRFAFTACALLLLPPALAFADGLPDLGDVAQADLSPALEQRIGQSVLNEYRADPDFVDDAEIVGYVNRVGQKLASHIDDPSQSFQFFVLRDATLNAFAMPGGYIGVHTGLIAAAESESELAGVLAHEISHVTQRHLARAFAKQDRETVPMMVAMALAILAARNSAQAGMGGLAAVSAGNIQSQLNYSRAYEQEADRMGLQLLDRSGYDVRGMEGFFQRLLRFSSLYEGNAPGYLRTHPLTTDRIADMGNRIEHMQKRTLPDSLDLRLVQAKILATDGQGRDAVLNFQLQLREKTYRSELAAWYGLAIAQLRAFNFAGAAQALTEVRRCEGIHPKATSPMIETLAAQIQQKQGDVTGAEATLRAALQRWPQDRAVSYALIGLLQDANRHDAALRQVKYDQQYWPNDPQLYLLQVKSYTAQGKQLMQHKALAEAYALRGQWSPAIEQLTLAQKAPDGDFFEYSQVDARLRELKQKKADEAKDKF